MDYNNIIVPLEGENYNSYIQRILASRNNIKIEIGQEHHHIIPKSMGGADVPENLIWLYRSEHAKAHQLYSNEHPENQELLFAAFMLSTVDGTLLTDEELDFLAKQHAKNTSERMKGKNNPNYGKTMHLSKETRGKISIANKGRKRTQEMKDKQSSRCKQDENFRNRLTNYWKGKDRSGENNPMYGVQRFGESNPNYGNRLKENPLSIPVICLNTLTVYSCAKEAAIAIGIHGTNITACIKGRSKSAGKDENGNKLYWMYYSDYLKQQEEGDE